VFEHEVNKFYEVVIPSGVTDTGKYQINKSLYYLVRERLTIGRDNPGFILADNCYNFDSMLPADWAWQYTVGGKGKYVGTFTRRVSKYIKNTFGFNLTDAELSTIGQLARDNNTSELTVHIDFDAELNWRAGDFGDRTSCYWDGNNKALVLLKLHQAHAVRVWNGEHTKGSGRAWLMPPEIHGLGDFLIVFNGTSTNHEYDTLWFTRLLAIFWGLEYHRVYFSGGDVSENLYGSACIVGKLADVSSVDSVRLNWEDIDYEEEGNEEYTCHNCGWSDDDEDNFRTDDDGYIYCLDCYAEIYVSCYYCDEELTRDDVAEYDYKYYCTYHAGRHLAYCDNCNCYCLNNDAIEVDGVSLCQKCSVDENVIASYTGDTDETN